MPLRSSFASRLKAFSPPQLAMVALGSLVLAGAGTAAAAGLLTGALARDSAFTGGDQDVARTEIIEGSATRLRATTPKSSVVPGQSPARNARRAEADGPRNGPSDLGASSGSGGAPVPTGAGGPSAPSGPSGDTGGAGPKGDTGGAGPQADGGAGSSPGAAGPKGDTGSGGPTGSPGSGGAGSSGPTGAPGSGGATPPGSQTAPGAPTAPAVLVVKDADGTTAGTLVGADPSAAWLTFSFQERAYVANAQTGELALPTVDTSYVTDDCTGTPYSSLSRPAKSVLRSANPGETGLYEFGQPGSVDVRSIWQPIEGEPGDCLQYVYTNSELAPLRELSASDRPPTLRGPLKAVRAS